MFSQILQNANAVDAGIAIGGQINLSRKFIGGDNPIFREAYAAVTKMAGGPDRICKTELLNLWKDECLTFAAKCLVTLWWGRPNFRVTSRVYSSGNLRKMETAEFEGSFKALTDELDLSKFKEGLNALSAKLSREGESHLNGIDISFYTKFFHFWFASHPPKSCPRYLPVIADKIMREAVFAEMMDRGEDVNLVFDSNDAYLRSSSYVAFADKFNKYADEFGVEPFLLEDKLFNFSRRLGDMYVAAYNRRLSFSDRITVRYDETECTASVVNEKSKAYLFEGQKARLLAEAESMRCDNGGNIDTEEICSRLHCSRFELLSFMKELRDKKIILA